MWDQAGARPACINVVATRGAPAARQRRGPEHARPPGVQPIIEPAPTFEEPAAEYRRPIGRWVCFWAAAGLRGELAVTPVSPAAGRGPTASGTCCRHVRPLPSPRGDAGRLVVFAELRNLSTSFSTGDAQGRALAV